MSAERRGSTLTPEQLTDKARKANAQSFETFGQPLVPPSMDNEEGIASLVASPLRDLVGRYRRRAGIYSQIIRDERSGEEISDERRDYASNWLAVLNNLDNYVVAHYANGSERTLYDMQMDVFEKLRDFLEQGNTEGYFKLPTSFGKTVLFTELLQQTQ
jgi:hypothetical protein